MIRPVTCFLAFLSLSIFYAYGGKKYLVETNDEEANGTTPVDGKWNDWGSWGACHKGKRYRFRKCNNPPPKNGGVCYGKAYQEETCPPGDNAHEGDLAVTGPKTRVPVDGFWSEWGDWNKCVGFVHVRKRQCNNPPPSNEGKSCPGAPLEAGPCQPETNSTLPHPVNGEWSDWGSWSSCHNDKRFRFRQCNNPPPKYGGFCLGRSFQEDDCGPAGADFDSHGCPPGYSNDVSMGDPEGCYNIEDGCQPGYHLKPEWTPMFDEYEYCANNEYPGCGHMTWEPVMKCDY